MLETIKQPRLESRPLIGSSPVEYSAQIPELYLRAFVDSYSCGIAVLDGLGDILYVNRGWREFATRQGFEPDFYGVGCNYPELRAGTPDALLSESRAIAEGVKQVLLGRQTEYQKEYLTRESKDRHWVRVHATRFDLPQAVRVLITQENITESIHARDARQKEAERLQFLLNVTRILPWEANFPDWSFTYVGEQAVQMLGYPLDDWYQDNFWLAHLHPEDSAPTLANCINYSTARDHYELEYRMIASDGRVVWLHNLVTVIRENGEAKAIRGFSIDITESKQKETVLQELSKRLINAQEEERRRLARELHDDLSQRMALLSFELEQLRQTKKPGDRHLRIESLQDQIKEISADIHRLSYKLHPSKLDHLGLAPAIKSLCEELSTKGKLEVSLEQTGFPADLPKDVTLCVFRIAQEALQNCTKHSGAASAHLVLKHTSDEVQLSVSDDGCGFEMKSDTVGKGLGFTSMRERLRIVGGKMKIHSRPMQGTLIEVSVPLNGSPNGSNFEPQKSS